MPVTDATRDALDLDKLSLPPSPKVVRLDIEDFTDMDGEASLRVTAVIDEDTNLERVRGKDVGDLKAEIRRSLQQHGIDLFPYIFLAKPSELEEVDEEG